MQHVAAGTGFVDEHEPGGLAVQPADQFVDVAVARADRADEVRRVGALSLGVGHRDGILVHVQTDEKRSRLSHG